jgi:hypothetical protein
MHAPPPAAPAPPPPRPLFEPLPGGLHARLRALVAQL